MGSESTEDHLSDHQETLPFYPTLRPKLTRMTTGTASEVSRKSTKDHQRITKGLNTLKPPKTGKTALHLQGQQEINQGSPTEDHQGTQHTQTPRNRKNRLADTSSSTGTPCCTWKTWKILEILKTIQITQYIGLGPPSWLIPTPRYVAHVSYLTTRKAPPETPCSTPLVRTRRPEWLILTRGQRSQVSIRFTPKTEKTIKN